MKSPLILRLDVVGKPVSWVPWQIAACLYSRKRVAWTAGVREFVFYGGMSRLTGSRSQLSINSIIAVKGICARYSRHEVTPPLSNRELFIRDSFLCMYCGKPFQSRLLTRDHIIPMSRGGTDIWPNVVTACRSCNTTKGCRTPEEAAMPILAVPYVPNWAEYLALCNRKILADQMEFLRKQFSHKSRFQLHSHLKKD